VLMASTYPIEVIEADRWLRLNPRLKDEALEAALLEKNWDPSVKAITHFPSILALMSERITETTELGNAFLAQEAEVMDMVQGLRSKAHAQGNLASTTQQKVIVEKQTIIIQPADPRIIYVPYYDPFYVYGPWWHPAYPPYYWGPAGVSIGYGVSYWPGFYFRFAFGTWSSFDWYRRTIYIDVRQRPRYVRQEVWLVQTGYWQHAPSHRRGVAYSDRATARKYGQPLSRSREIGRDSRGYRTESSEGRGTGRTGIEQSRRGDNRTRVDRDRQERIEGARQERAPVRQGQQRFDNDRQAAQRLERERPGRVVQEVQVPDEREQHQGRRDKDERVEQPERQAAERDQKSRKKPLDDGQQRGRSDADDDRGRNRR
jgi:hypothetical protein